MNARAVWLGVCVGLLIGTLWLTPVAGQPAAANTATENATPEGVTIASGLTDTSGEQTVVVRLADRPTPAITTSRHNTPADALQAHAAATQSALKRFAAGTPHVNIDRRLWLTNAMVVTVDTNHVPLTRLGMIDHVEGIHANHKITTATGPSATAAHSSHPRTQQGINTLTAMQLSATAAETTTGLQRIDVPEAWAYTRGANASIAVLDTGVDPSHPDISVDPTHWNDWYPNGTSRETTAQDYGEHGTHVAGTAVGGNASGKHIGVAPEATLYVGAALNQNCNTNGKCAGTIAQLIAGMQWAVREDVDVISMSLGGVEENDNYIDRTASAVRNAEAAGTVVVAAAGNSGPGSTTSPGNVYDAVSVGATTGDGTVADFSSDALVRADAWDDAPADWPKIYSVPTVVAPGVRIRSSVPGGGYTKFSGTSQATPHVAGTVALMRAASHEQLLPDEIESVIESTAVEVDAEQTRQGAGRIDTAAAVGTVVPKSNITTSINAAPNRIRIGNTLKIGYTATNTGGAAGNATLEFQINGTSVATNATGALDPGEQTTGTFRYQLGYNETGSLTATVSSDSGSDSRVITVNKLQVQLTDVQLTPKQVSQTVTTHTLNVTVRNVSDDGQPDVFTVTMPDQVSIDNETVSAVDVTGTSIPVTNTTVMNRSNLKFALSPNTNATIRDVEVTARFDAYTVPSNST